METPVRFAPHLTIQDPLAAAGAVVLDCRPQVLPGAMDVSGTDMAESRSMSRAGVVTAVPPKREQSFGGGGGDLLSLICPELGVTPPVDTGTDLEDELSIPASPPADVNHEVVLYMRAEVDSELEQVFGDVGSLPTMVTAVCDIDGALRVPPVECPVIAPPGVSASVTRPSMAPSPEGPKCLSPGFSHPSPASVDVLSVPRTSPVVAVPEEFMLLNATNTNQTQSEAGPSFMGELAGVLFPAIPLTPCPAAASRHGGELDAVGGGGGPRKSRSTCRSTYTRIIRRLSAVAAGHQGVSISDDILRCGGRWTKFCTSLWGPAPRSTSAGVCRCSGIVSPVSRLAAAA